MKNVGILSVGHYTPSRVLTNFDLEKKVDTTDEWIRTRTGIEERRMAEEHETVADMGYKSAVEALEKANLQPSDIDLLIVATATPDHRFPSTACAIQDRLKTNAVAMDLSAACSGFMYGMITAQQFLQNGVYKRALIIGAEKLSTLLDWNDRTTCVLFGDGAGAVVLGEVSEGRGILSFELGADGSGGKHLYDNEHDHIIMNGREVFKFAVRKMDESSMNVLNQAGLKKEDIDLLVPHQANIRIIDYARERLELPPEKVMVTVNRYGNTSAASIPLSLYHALEEGKVQDDNVLVMVGFGGGLTWGAITLKWGK